VRQRGRAIGLVVAGLLGAFGAACGGGASGGGGLIPPPDDPTLLDVQAQVFTQRCALAGCHAGAGSPFGLDLSNVSDSESNLVGVASAEQPGFQRVEPFNAADSYLYMKLINDPRISGDPMPLSGPPLGDSDLALIEDWINLGAN
jgi:hypothetical protein